MTIIALAGRRIDAPDTTTSRFPADNIPLVRERLAQLFTKLDAERLICSGACGADLLALDVAGEMNIPRHMVLPFGKKQFREISVVDRLGSWGTLFDRIIAELSATKAIKVFATTHDLYRDIIRANEHILRTAQNLADDTQSVAAILVWDGAAHSAQDMTAAFGTAASARDIPLHEVSTC